MKILHKVWSQSISDIRLQKAVINTLNAYSYVMAKKISEFKVALQNSDILLPDGFPIVLANKLLNKKKIRKIAGADIHEYLLKKAEKNGLSVFYLGSSEPTLKLITERIYNDYSNISVSYFSPPYRQEFSLEETTQMIAEINKKKPDILFVGMTAPKQEIWSYKNRDKIDAKVICCIGAVFDFYAGTVKRAPKWMINLYLEWLYRLLREPKRMWKRYLVYSLLFFWDLFLYLTRIKK